MDAPKLRQGQLELLTFVMDHSPITVREAATRFGEKRGLARTTILTVMEQLRKKGFLTRKDRGGVWEYSAALAKSDLLRKLTGTFADKVLGRSLSPLFAYLVEDADISDEQLAELREIVDALDERRKKP